MLWIVPAVLVVGVIGLKFASPRIVTYHFPGSESTLLSDGQVQSMNQRTVDRRGDSEPGGKVVVMTKVADEYSSSLPAEVPLEGLSVPPTAPSAPVGPAQPKSPTTALTQVLKVRETKPQPPDWAGKDPVPRGESVLVPLSSQMWATMREAEQQVTERAAAYVKEFYHDEYPVRGDWTVPVPVIEQTAVSALVGEEIDKDFGDGIGTKKMYRAHLRLDVNPSLRNALHASWHDQIVNHRLTELGGLFGLATLMLATAAGYFRLDDATAGQYRRRLKFAAGALVAAGSLVVWQIVA
jgi:hypothetical protein